MTLSMFTSSQPEIVNYATCPDSPAGELLLGLTDNRELCRVGFIGKQSALDNLKQWQTEWPNTEFVKTEKTITYKALQKANLLMIGTNFQHKVWRGLLTIPSGDTLSYSALAKRIKKPKAARAVGGACGKNPIPLLVPCHRVIAENGSIGGFSSDRSIKVRLLKLEKTT